MVNYNKPKIAFLDNLIGNREAGKQLFLLSFVLITLHIMNENKDYFLHTNLTKGIVIHSYSEQTKRNYYQHNIIQFKVENKTINTSTDTYYTTFNDNESVYIFYKTANPYVATIWSLWEMTAETVIYFGFLIVALFITIYKICF